MAFKHTLVCDTLAFLGYDVFQNPQEILAAIKNAGYDGADIPGSPEKADPAKLRKIADSLELKIPEVLGAWAYFHAGENRDLAGEDEEARRRGIEYAKKGIDFASALGASFFEVCAAQPPIPQIPFPHLPIKTLRKNFLESLKEICDHAGKRDIAILFEPLNCYEGYPGVLTTLYEAISLIHDLGYENTGIQPDVFHMNVSEGSIPDSLRAAGKLVRHFHLNETNRYALGTGHGEHKLILRTLKEIGFTGHLALYMPLISQEACQPAESGYSGSDSTQGTTSTDKPDLDAILTRQLSYVKDLESRIELQREVYRMGSPYGTVPS